MKRIALAMLVLPLAATGASAADHMLVLSDQEMAALYQVLDSATKAQGLQIAPQTVYLLNKMKAAPVVTEHTDAPAPQATAPEQKPAEEHKPATEQAPAAAPEQKSSE